MCMTLMSRRNLNESQLIDKDSEDEPLIKPLMTPLSKQIAEVSSDGDNEPLSKLQVSSDGDDEPLIKPKMKPEPIRMSRLWRRGCHVLPFDNEDMPIIFLGLRN